MNSSTVYLLQDGTYAAKGDCKKGDDGVMRHKDGLAVQMTAEGEPMTLEMVGEMNEPAANPPEPEKEAPVESDQPTEAPQEPAEVPKEPAEAPAKSEPDAPKRAEASVRHAASEKR